MTGPHTVWTPTFPDGTVGAPVRILPCRDHLVVLALEEVTAEFVDRLQDLGNQVRDWGGLLLFIDYDTSLKALDDDDLAMLGLQRITDTP